MCIHAISDEFIEDHLSYAYHLHRIPATQYLHCCTYPFVFVGIMYAVTQFLPIWLPFLFILYISISFARRDLLVAVLWTYMLLGFMAMIEELNGPLKGYVPLPRPRHRAVVGLGVTFLALMMEHAGYVIHEKRQQPPFRLYQAVVVTPFMSLLFCINFLFGYRSVVCKKVKRAARKWELREKYDAK